MKWPSRDITKWHRRFAWLPVIIGEQRVWLEPYEARQIAAHVFVDVWERRRPAQGIETEGGDAKTGSGR